MQKNKDLILGTAMWGWNTPRDKCFDLLDTYYLNGFRHIDTATNYPINKDQSLFRFAEDILAEWTTINRVNDLKIIMKVGSLNNLGTPEINLEKSFLLLSHDYYEDKFKNNLDNFMIHWDNRADPNDITSTFEALELVQKKNCHVGLSGIRFPELYYKVNQKFKLKFTIEFKLNLLTSQYNHYKNFHHGSRFIVYGINGGGIKFNTTYSEKNSVSLRKVSINQTNTIIKAVQDFIKTENPKIGNQPIVSFNQLSLLNAFHYDGISGIIIAPSTMEQMKESITAFSEFKRKDHSHLFTKLNTHIVDVTT